MKHYMTQAEFTDFINTNEWNLEGNHVRPGVAMFNALVKACPAVAENIRGTEFDMYWHDDRCELFWKNIVLPDDNRMLVF